ncbi:MAG TPA: hypothetical protein PLZ36_10160 [Armatimonadota bacterium]|nr:hypothetical protein [Armatimonadota bacterium]HOS42748.1 hypothetical protein [Armatimonadota bacterium]
MARQFFRLRQAGGWLLALLVVAAILLWFRHPGQSATGSALRVGIRHSGLLAPVYQLADRAPSPITLRPFLADGDIGLALQSGEIDAAFIAVAPARQLLTRGNFRVAGGIEYPFSATLILRKQVKLRLTELAGRTIGAGEPDCALLTQFRADAKKLGVDLSAVRFTYLPDDALVPALEAGRIDGAIVSSATALHAEALGHKVLYRSVKISGHDHCCPRFSRQMELLLVVRPGHAPAVAAVRKQLVALSRAATADDAQRAILRHTGYPASLVTRAQAPTFSPLDAEWRTALGSAVWKGE